MVSPGLLSQVPYKPCSGPRPPEQISGGCVSNTGGQLGSTSQEAPLKSPLMVAGSEEAGHPPLRLKQVLVKFLAPRGGRGEGWGAEEKLPQGCAPHLHPPDGTWEHLRKSQDSSLEKSSSPGVSLCQEQAVRMEE